MNAKNSAISPLVLECLGGWQHQDCVSQRKINGCIAKNVIRILLANELAQLWQSVIIHDYVYIVEGGNLVTLFSIDAHHVAFNEKYAEFVVLLVGILSSFVIQKYLVDSTQEHCEVK